MTQVQRRPCGEQSYAAGCQVAHRVTSLKPHRLHSALLHTNSTLANTHHRKKTSAHLGLLLGRRHTLDSGAGQNYPLSLSPTLSTTAQAHKHTLPIFLATTHQHRHQLAFFALPDPAWEPHELESSSNRSYLACTTHQYKHTSTHLGLFYRWRFHLIHLYAPALPSTCCSCCTLFSRR